MQCAEITNKWMDRSYSWHNVIADMAGFVDKAIHILKTSDEFSSNRQRFYYRYASQLEHVSISAPAVQFNSALQTTQRILFGGFTLASEDSTAKKVLVIGLRVLLGLTLLPIHLLLAACRLASSHIAKKSTCRLQIGSDPSNTKKVPIKNLIGKLPCLRARSFQAAREVAQQQLGQERKKVEDKLYTPAIDCLGFGSLTPVNLETLANAYKIGSFIDICDKIELKTDNPFFLYRKKIKFGGDLKFPNPFYKKEREITYNEYKDLLEFVVDNKLKKYVKKSRCEYHSETANEPSRRLAEDMSEDIQPSKVTIGQMLGMCHIKAKHNPEWFFVSPLLGSITSSLSL